MKTIDKKKDFDCIAMKNAIQTKIYAETKDMNVEELLSYFNRHLQTDALVSGQSAMQKRKGKETKNKY